MTNLRTSGVFNLGALGGDGASTTRPTRRWGGMTGRSLVESTPASGDEHWDDVTLLLDGSGSTDLSPASPTITPSSSAPTAGNSGGKNGEYIAFDGTNNYYNVALNQAIGDSRDPFTVECWVYFDNIVNDGVFQLLRSGSTLDGSADNASSSLAVAAYNNSWTIYHDAGQNTVGSVATGTWYHIALVWDGTDLVFYVDGSAALTKSNWTSAISATGYPNIGIGGYYTTSYVMDGRIEDFRVTKDVARDIAADWAAGVYNSALPQGAAVAASTTVPTTGVLSLPELLQERYGPPWDGLIEYLIIGGGGQSGNNGGGGGGAGGVVTNFGGTPAAMIAGSTYTITVGEGGGTVTNLYGGNSSISNIGAATAIGGGAGGSRGGLTMTSGGSGGGGGHGRSNADSSTGASGTPGQGYAGGTGTSDLGGSSAGGGGGGFGGAGGNASSQNGGDGGAGFNSSITGTSTGYAGGGAGSGLDYSNFGGVSGTASHGGGGRNNSGPTANSGGGGGGFGDGTNTGSSGAQTGAAGVVIIRMAKAGRLVKVSGTPSLPTPVNIAGTDDKYYRFTTVGSIIVQPA